ERITAIPELLQDRPETGVIILDDALQHRRVKAGCNILLTDFSNLFTRDFFLPAGNLRDQRSSYERADMIVVTKCPPDLTKEAREKILKEIRILPYQAIFFTTIQYGVPYHLFNRNERQFSQKDKLLVVCGIARPAPFIHFLKQQAKSYELVAFPNHHAFTATDVNHIRKKYDRIHGEQKLIVTTEKDAVRLLPFTKELVDIPVFVLPVQHRFLFDGGMQFDNIVTTFIETFTREKNNYE
ncbi:MAG TPA: tetraacyldisaccharide 4'-kinase, partial [Segetibacter sp.]